MSDWSTFGSEVSAQRKVRGPKCAVAHILADIPADELAGVNRVLANRGITNSSIAKALHDRLGDDAPSLWSVSNHRRGACKCDQ